MSSSIVRSCPNKSDIWPVCWRMVICIDSILLIRDSSNPVETSLPSGMIRRGVVALIPLSKSLSVNCWVELDPPWFFGIFPARMWVRSEYLNYWFRNIEEIGRRGGRRRRMENLGRKKYEIEDYDIFFLLRITRQLKRVYIVALTIHCYPHSLSPNGSTSTGTVHTVSVCMLWRTRVHAQLGRVRFDFRKLLLGPANYYLGWLFSC